MAAGRKLPLTEDPFIAAAFAAMLQAFCQDKTDQTVLAQEQTLAVLCLLLQVTPSIGPAQLGCPANVLPKDHAPVPDVILCCAYATVLQRLRAGNGISPTLISVVYRHIWMWI